MITIRRAKGEDTDSVWRVHTQAIEEICQSHYTPDEVRAWSRLLKPERYERAIGGESFLVAEEGDVIVGFGYLDQHLGRVEALYVSPKYTGRGIGKKILQTLEGIARNTGLKLLHLSATLNAISFYERAGYKSQNHSKHLLPSGLVNTLSMAKDLSS
ncbi:MAG: GNAT family N-acetyltransferase [Deltaproteobacteria bacterium]|nr:MAG: GNAT family N-acetyltransferase [Deltaproteobacteria bacterium]